MLRVYLKAGVPMMTMVACFIYDLALFLIFSVNILYHDNSILATTELSLIGSCLLFGILFEIGGRKKIFTGRLCVTSCASLLVAFGPQIPIPIVKQLPFQSFAFVMCSVSISVPVISDFVKHKKRGIAYSYTGLLLALALITVQLVYKFDKEETVQKEWFFIFTSSFGLISAVTLCSFFQDKQDFSIQLKISFFVNRLKKILSSAKRNITRDRSVYFVVFSMFVINSVIFSIFFVNYDDIKKPSRYTDIIGGCIGILLIPTLFITGIRTDRQSPWTVLIPWYITMILSLLIFALEGDSGDVYEEIPRIIGYAGSIVSCFNIFLTNLIIISKQVSRECRGFLFGITCASGSTGAFTALTLGQLIHDKINYETLFALEMILCLLFIIVYFCLGGNSQFVQRRLHHVHAV